MWIEIFRTGQHTDSDGRTGDFPPHRLDQIASTYNSRILEEPTMSAPVVKGHPASDEPAYGWVDRLARRGNRLMAFVRDLSKDFAEEVREGRYKKVSIALYPDMMLKHIGFLGAAAPAVKGLQEAQFHSSDDSSVYEYADFSMSEFEFEYLQAENIKLNKEIELIRKENRLKEFREFANGLIAGEKGAVIMPSQAPVLVDILEMAYNQDRISELSGIAKSVGKVKEFFSALRPIFRTDEFAQSDTVQSGIIEQFASENVDRDRLALHEKAMKLQAETPNLSYEEAVFKVQRDLFNI